ncbi:hypothetical protein Trydic_g3249 [Trypoxylus dichotomus]
MWPPAKTVFTDDDFLSSTTTDIQLVDLRTNNNQVTDEDINYQNTEIVHSEVTGSETSVLNDKRKGLPKQKMCRPRRESASSDTDNEQDAECLYCLDLYSKSTEGAHNPCADTDSEDYEAVFVCELYAT